MAANDDGSQLVVELDGQPARVEEIRGPEAYADSTSSALSPDC